MTRADTNGRHYAKLSEVKAGDAVELDAGFTCMKAGKYEVHADEAGSLYVICADGHHYIDGQADDGEHLIGVYLASNVEA